MKPKREQIRINVIRLTLYCKLTRVPLGIPSKTPGGSAPAYFQNIRANETRKAAIESSKQADHNNTSNFLHKVRVWSRSGQRRKIAVLACWDHKNGDHNMNVKRPKMVKVLSNAV